MKKPLLLIGVVLAFITSIDITSRAQSIAGKITDETGDPIPFASVLLQELKSGTTANEQGEYFLTVDPGIYHVIVSSLGYTSVKAEIVVPDKPITKNFTLPASSIELEAIEVRARKRDPAYEIIKQAIAHREKNNAVIKSSRSTIYLRAMETIDKKKKQVSNNKPDDDDDRKGPPVDPLLEARKKEEARLQQINLVEMNVVVNYQFPDKYKEEREGFKAYGNREGLFIPVFSESNFNFYENLVALPRISEVPVISPLSTTSVLSYKFKLEETIKTGTEVIYKIRVTPRKSGDATVRGHIFIMEGTWNIHSLDLTIHKGTLRFYDDFTIRQRYTRMNDDVWVVDRQEFDYQTKAGSKLFKGNTVMSTSKFQNDFVFPSNFFGNEVAITTKDAYKRDTTYWKESRTEALTGDQKKVIDFRDSIEALHSSQKYLDSIEAKFNRITIGEILLHGPGFRNQAKKQNVMLPSLTSLIGFEVVGGFRLGPYVHYWREFESGRQMWTNINFSIGLKNYDWQGGMNFWTRYNPKKIADFSVRVGRNFYSINSFDAYLNQLKISNYILHEHVDLFHRFELTNGFYIGTELNFSNRQSLEGYDATSIINEVIDETDPLAFEGYQALISTLRLSYTPQQRYMTEPNRKIVLGSKWPTFISAYRKGWDGAFTSDIDFDYGEIAIEQNLLFGTLGNSKYNVMAGKFFNTRDLRYVDLKRFRQSDPYLYSNPLHSFQLLDTSLNATNLFIEGHYIHHFNGAMINNIPFVKKLKLRTVAGAGFMWIKESGYRHEEIFAGVERTFKLGARRRLRVGVFGVLAQSNQRKPDTDFKISFDVIDTWKREWSY